MSIRRISNLIGAAPEALNTLNELAAALSNDANYVTTVQNQFASKAPLASPSFTGTVSGISKSMVGLGNVDNPSDANKPISSATQPALDAKAPLASPSFTGTVNGITKSMVGLGNVDNTADADKAISSATQTALNAKQNAITSTTTVTASSFVKAGGTNTDYLMADGSTSSFSSGSLRLYQPNYSCVQNYSLLSHSSALFLALVPSSYSQLLPVLNSQFAIGTDSTGITMWKMSICWRT